MKKPSKFTRFDTFVGISIGLHVAAVVGFMVLALLPKTKPPLTIASFELVGNPPKGNDGGSSPLPVARGPETEPVEPPSEVPVAPEAPAPPTPPTPKPLPPKPTEKTMPTRPDKSVQPVPKTPPPTSTATTAAPKTSAPAASAGQQASGATSKVQQGTSGKPGQAGRAGGDTLSVGGGQGLPSPMAMWLSRVKYVVERNWRAPPGLAGIASMPEIVFSVARDGRPSMAQLRQRSGNPTLDRLALRAIQSVDVFPPVPDAWPEDKVVLRYVLQYAP